MANRRPHQGGGGGGGGGGGRRMEFRNDRNKNYGRTGVSPWQGGGPGASLPALLPPLAAGSTEATLALASNIINLLQPRPNPVPSLLDMPIRRDFVPNMGRFDRSYGPNRMGNQGYFRRTGNYNRAGERINTNRKQFKPNDGQKQQNKSSPKKEADSKAKPVKESEDGQPSENKEDRKEAPKTRYDDINPQLLKCHICNKSMWDGRSFENHLSGRAHAIMMQKTAESYALTADTMRQEFKIREMKRTRKSGQQPARDFYCAMCDMYAADGAAHRTTVGHRKLKKYLHPTCTSCHKEMPTRIELDEHRLTAEHLKNMQDKQEVVIKPKPEVMVISSLSMEQSYLRDDRQRRRRHDDHEDREQDSNKNGEDQAKKESVENEGAAEGDGNEPEGEEKKEKNLIDKEDTILDYKEGDDLSHVTSEMLPSYSTERGVGESFLSEFRCFQCRLCHKLLDSEETAQVHLRTWKHHQLFIRSLQPQKEIGGKRSGRNDDDEGNYKRRKVANDDNENDAEEEQNGLDDNTVKNEEQGGDDADGDAEEMPTAEELEDWEQTVDEILDDENKNSDENNDEDIEAETKQDDEETPDKEEEPVPEPEVLPAPVVEEKPSRGTPRGRGRGRGRARGRY